MYLPLGCPTLTDQNFRIFEDTNLVPIFNRATFCVLSYCADISKGTHSTYKTYFARTGHMLFFLEGRKTLSIFQPIRITLHLLRERSLFCEVHFLPRLLRCAEITAFSLYWQLLGPSVPMRREASNKLMCRTLNHIFFSRLQGLSSLLDRFRSSTSIVREWTVSMLLVVYFAGVSANDCE